MKDELRYKYKIKRKYFQHSQREVADGVIADRLMDLFAEKTSFLVYFSYGSEADTHALISRLLAAGKKVYLPRVEGENMVAVPFSGDEGTLKKSAFGIMEPTGQAYGGDVDVIITPLLAVNERGFRLGYGGGYYDRYFSSHKGGVKVGIGYYLQYAEEFIEEGRDVPLDLFVCERGIIHFGK